MNALGSPTGGDLVLNSCTTEPAGGERHRAAKAETSPK
ncbi:hypothetical protein SBD_6998 [Streptomyces bottropensis ATCC 25435]|uniref:Uncharacterized protein n=1 Tax=Streptomyces bottropensis ATCC 25435 TaxID=1054862 RepID=M3EQH5_9ACTN|nr:hypothetical protein SBD_6998 [Streptomyces bottropensis ATCC 25435]